MTLIYAYTRTQAIADGVLIDVSTTAREAGIIWPVALTSALWDDIADIPAPLQGLADVAGRLWDVLWMARMAIHRSDASDLTYELILPVGDGEAELYTVRAVAGPGDAGEPVITLMRPNES
jgi:hypothetical protein